MLEDQKPRDSMNIDYSTFNYMMESEATTPEQQSPTLQQERTSLNATAVGKETN